MPGQTKIEWAEKVWNPIRGCSRVSEGCRNCYAERIAGRFSGPGQPYESLVKLDNSQRLHAHRIPTWTGKIITVPEALDAPLKWKKPARIFVNSMSDLFHEGVPEPFIDRIFAVMLRACHHQYLILTKRPERMKKYLSNLDVMERVFNLAGASGPWPLLHVWLGVSIENQATADRRIPLLATTTAAVRWVSYEPALGPVDFSFIDFFGLPKDVLYRGIMAPVINWIVAGGESGPGARPAHPDWFRAVRDQCAAAEIPFFFKQWGEWIPGSHVGKIATNAELSHILCQECEYDAGRTINHSMSFKIGKKRAGRLLDGREYSEYPIL